VNIPKPCPHLLDYVFHHLDECKECQKAVVEIYSIGIVKTIASQFIPKNQLESFNEMVKKWNQ
jgi:hypothetical protein